MRDLMRNNIRVDQSFTVKNEIMAPLKIKQSQTRSSFGDAAGSAVNETRILGRHSLRGEPNKLTRPGPKLRDDVGIDKAPQHGLPRSSHSRTILAAPPSQEPLCSRKPTLETSPTFLEEKDDWEDEEKLIASLA